MGSLKTVTTANMLIVLLMCIGLFGTGCVSYKAELSTLRAVPGVQVTVAEASGNFWRVDATNQTSDVVKLVWDDSSYVSTTGQTTRLVRGNTRVIHSGQAQPSSPIPPGATLTEHFISEGQIQAAGSMYRVAPGDPERTGRVYLVFEVAGRRQPFEAEVRFKKPNKE